VTFELGVNYWPRRRAMYMWRELDLAEVQDEMAQIADIGFDVVRLFALTQDFLPAPLSVDTEMVARLVNVAAAAKDAGLRVVPTLVVLNMSGRIWWPAWMLDDRGRPADLYSDPAVLRSEALLVETCARALAGDDAIRAFDLSNEIDDAQRPRSRDAGWLWASLLANTVRRFAPGVPIQIGAHLPSLTAANNMRVDDLAAVADEDVMHAYPLYCDVARSFLDPELVPFACALTAGLSGRGRPPLMQEFGLCTAPPGRAGADNHRRFPRASAAAVPRVGGRGGGLLRRRARAVGAHGGERRVRLVLRGLHGRLFARPPLDTAVRERTFGLVRADESEKPAAGVVRAFRTRRDAGALIGSYVPAVLDVSAEKYYRMPAAHFERLYGDWLSRGRL
jgi:endo-1,4-beta-mannosidase